jgi:hypothetical protein
VVENTSSDPLTLFRGLKMKNILGQKIVIPAHILFCDFLTFLHVFLVVFSIHLWDGKVVFLQNPSERGINRQIHFGSKASWLITSVLIYTENTRKLAKNILHSRWIN